MTYDPENQMGSHENENGDATYYSYDPNMHLKQDVHLVGTTRWFVWLDDLIVRQDDTSGIKRIFTVNDGVIVGEVYSVTSHAQTRSYLEDFLGSVTGEMTTSNVVSNSRRFTPYGRDWLGVPSVAHSPAWIGGHGYHPTGLKWAGYSVFHRVVTPETGQWTTRDPVWPEELAYGYVNGNPTTWVDIKGNGPLKPPVHREPIEVPRPGRHGGSMPESLPGGQSPYPRPNAPAPDGFAWVPTATGVLVLVLVLLPCAAGPLKPPLQPWKPPSRRPQDKNKCDELRARYKASCKEYDRLYPNPCANYTPGIPKATSNFYEFTMCAKARLEYLLQCDVSGGGADKPNWCMHAQDICRVFGATIECGKKAGYYDSGSEMPVDDPNDYRKWCNAAAKKCATDKRFGKGRWPWPKQ